MPIEIPLGGGGGGRVPVQFRTFTYNTLALLQADAQANPTLLLNNASRFSVARVTADPNTALNGNYEYKGTNNTYEASGWQLTDELSGADRATLNSIQALDDNTIPLGNMGSLANSPLKLNTTTQIVESTRALRLPGGGALEFDNNDMSSGGTVSGGAAGVRFENRSDSTKGYLISVPFTSDTGSGKPFYDKFGAEVDAPSLSNKSDTRNAEFDFVNPLPGIVTEYTVSRAAGTATLTDCNFTIWLQGYGVGTPLFDYKESNPGGAGFTLSAGENVVVPPVPIGFPANINPNAPANEQIRLYARVVDSNGNLIQLEGQEVTFPPAPDPRSESVWIPFLERKVHFSTKTELEDSLGNPTTNGQVLASTTTGTRSWVDLPSTRTDEQIQDVIGGMVEGNTETGIVVTYDDVNGKLNFVVGQAYMAPQVTSFSIPGQATSVHPGDAVSGDQTFNFSVSNTGNVSGNLTLLAGSTVLSSNIAPTATTITVDVGTNVLTNVGDSATFTLRGTDTQGTQFSRNFVVTAVAPGEFFYYGLSGTNIPATVDVSTLTRRLSASETFNFSVGPTSAGQYIILLAPNDHDLTALINTALNVNVLNTYTKTTAVRTISGQSYNSFVFGPVNAGFTQNYRATTS